MKKNFLVKHYISAIIIIFLVFFYFGFYNIFFGGKNISKTPKIRIVVAHNKKIIEEADDFLKQRYRETYGKELEIEWIKYGGQNTNLKIVDAAFKQNNEKTCGFDAIWGGGVRNYYILHNQGRLATHNFSEEFKNWLPQKIGSICLYNEKEEERTWVATMLSTFLIAYNKEILKRDGIEPPTSWRDLADKRFLDKLAGVNPAESSSIWTLCEVILESYGFDEGWEILGRMAANSICFHSKSSVATNSIFEGEALVAPSIAYYVISMLENQPNDKITYSVPNYNENIFNVDPYATLTGALDPGLSAFICKSLLSIKFQQLMIKKKGTPGGPITQTFARISVVEDAYKGVPKSSIASHIKSLDDLKKTSIIDSNMDINPMHSELLLDLFECSFIKTHSHLKRAWSLIIKNDCDPKMITLLMKPLIQPDEFESLTKVWDDELIKTEKKLEWSNEIFDRCKKIEKYYNNN